MRITDFPPSPHTRDVHAAAGRIRRAAHMLAEGVVETIWTTRCIICDRPGNVLCACCRIQLPYIDRWLACPRCGSPHGGLQCVDCNTFSLSEVGRDNLPFERCVCAIEHRGMARAIITGYKDAGERRLSADIARIIADTLPRTWISPDSMLTFIPADRMARRRRGFDHMAAIAAELSHITQMPCTPLLQKACASDQRGLSRYERFQNMAGAIRMKPEASIQEGRRIILVDDVYTTGATLFAACDALRQAGARTVYCATFARVP